MNNPILNLHAFIIRVWVHSKPSGNALTPFSPHQQPQTHDFILETMTENLLLKLSSFIGIIQRKTRKGSAKLTKEN